MIDRNTSLFVIIDKAKTHIELKNLCVEIVEFEQLYSEDPNTTLGECLDSKATHLIKDSFYASGLIAISDELSSELRIEFIKKIKDPMTAFQVYMRIKKSTEEENTLLKDKFEDFLPTVKKELKEGKIKRVKN